MARKPNYGYEKRQKELKKKAKREAKLARKRAAQSGDADGMVSDEAPQSEDSNVGGDPDGNTNLHA